MMLVTHVPPKGRSCLIACVQIPHLRQIDSSPGHYLSFPGRHRQSTQTTIAFNTRSCGRVSVSTTGCTACDCSRYICRRSRTLRHHPPPPPHHLQHCLWHYPVYAPSLNALRDPFRAQMVTPYYSGPPSSPKPDKPGAVLGGLHIVLKRLSGRYATSYLDLNLTLEAPTAQTERRAHDSTWNT